MAVHDKDSYQVKYLTRSSTFTIYYKSSHDSEDRESFHGRFSTTTEEESTGAFGWILARDASLWRLVVMVMISCDLVFGFVRPFVAEPMHVSSKSMVPTLHAHDRVLTNKLAYDFTSPNRGDLAVFESVIPGDDERLVKRVVGLPGDEVSVRNGILLVNGKPPYEPYKKETHNPEKAPPQIRSFGPIVVPENNVFVMGDNRANSYDSRFFGPVPNENLIGEVSLRLWPPTRLGPP